MIITQKTMKKIFYSLIILTPFAISCNQNEAEVTQMDSETIIWKGDTFCSSKNTIQKQQISQGETEVSKIDNGNIIWKGDTFYSSKNIVQPKQVSQTDGCNKY